MSKNTCSVTVIWLLMNVNQIDCQEQYMATENSTNCAQRHKCQI